MMNDYNKDTKLSHEELMLIIDISLILRLGTGLDSRYQYHWYLSGTGEIRLNLKNKELWFINEPQLSLIKRQALRGLLLDRKGWKGMDGYLD